MRKYIFLIIAFASLAYKSFALDEYFITCDQAQFDDMLKNYTENTYINVTLTYQGKTWQDVQIRVRGEDTRTYPKKSFKVKFEGETFLDSIDGFNLNAEYADRSYMRQFLSSRVMREAGQPVYNVTHVRLYINGKFYGLYLKIEQYGKRFMRDRSINDEGNLYKASLQNHACLSIWDDIEGAWEKKTNEAQDRADLVELIQKLENVPDNEYYNLTHQIFDYNQMINFLALNIVVANTSTFYHNYYMYNDMFGTGKWYFLPWDMDKSIGTWYPNNKYNDNAAKPDNPVYEKSFLTPQIFSDLLKRIDTICKTIFNTNHLQPIIDSVKNEITASVAEDSMDNIPADSVWRKHLESNDYFIRERYNELLKQFPLLPRVFKVERTHGTYTGDIKLIWHPSYSPRGASITYKLTYSTDWFMLDTSETKIITNLTDTTYTFKKGDLPEGVYYWMVTAIDSTLWVDGYDNFNKFTYKSGSVLTSPITEDITLTKEGSPYSVEGDLEVTKNALLTIKNGVELYINGASNIYIRGSLKIEGTQSEPVYIKATSSDVKLCNLIQVYNGKGNSSIKWADFNNVFIHFLTSTNALLEDSKFYVDRDTNQYFIHCSGGNFTMRRCSVSSNGKRNPEGVVMMSTPTAYVEDSYFDKILDPVEYIDVKEGYIKNNRIINSTDDGIDLNGGKDILISNNVILDAYDKGISIGNETFGGAKNITVERNIIAGCANGLGIKDSAEVTLINNTLYHNRNGIMLYEKNANNGGGFATIKNCIIAGSIEKTLGVDEKSRASVSYSISDKDYLKDAPGSIFGDPQFVDAANYNFNLKSTSPCINSGDPASPKDPDGSRADIGAIPHNTGQPTLVINEINYNSSPDFDAADWIEFYNPGSEDADISDWYFSDGDDAHKYVFPEGTKVLKDSFLVLCRDKSKFSALYPKVKNYIGNFEFGLSAAGDLVRLFTQTGEIIDSLTYDDKIPWPEEPDGNGPTLELINPLMDNALPRSWKASSTPHGTPGEQNSVFSGVEDNVAFDGTTIKVAPNPADEIAAIEIILPQPAKISLGIYDISGRLVTSVIEKQLLEGGNHKYNINISGWLQQVYYCKLEAYYPNQFVISIPVIKIGK